VELDVGSPAMAPRTMASLTPVRKILFLTADPKGTEQRRLDQEVRRVEQALERAQGRDRYTIVVKRAATDDDLRHGLLDNAPEIVHFSGWGGRQKGLAFADDRGEPQIVSGESLSRLFGLCAHFVRCVVLNARYSEVQAQAISRHIGYVVGMSRATGD